MQYCYVLIEVGEGFLSYYDLEFLYLQECMKDMNE